MPDLDSGSETSGKSASGEGNEPTADGNKGSPRHLIQALHTLAGDREAMHRSAGASDLDPQLIELRRWQSERLAASYSDLLADPQYHSACEFFLTDIYTARDLSQRDNDAERLHALLSRLLPAGMLRLLTDTLHLNRLSHRLDLELCAALGEDEPITHQTYAQAYRRCNNRADRLEQIELLTAILGEAARGARTPVVGISLRLARPAALRAGWDELYHFLERGYQACKPMRAVDYFVETIYRREMTLLERLFSNALDPFEHLE